MHLVYLQLKINLRDRDVSCCEPKFVYQLVHRNCAGLTGRAQTSGGFLSRVLPFLEAMPMYVSLDGAYGVSIKRFGEGERAWMIKKTRCHTTTMKPSSTVDFFCLSDQTARARSKV